MKHQTSLTPLQIQKQLTLSRWLGGLSGAIFLLLGLSSEFGNRPKHLPSSGPFMLVMSAAMILGACLLPRIREIPATGKFSCRIGKATLNGTALFLLVIFSLCVIWGLFSLAWDILIMRQYIQNH